MAVVSRSWFKFVLLAASSAMSVQEAHSQVDIDFATSPVREPTLPLDREYQPGRGQDALFFAGQGRPTTKLLLIPAAGVTDAGASYGGTVGVIVPDLIGSMPVQLRAGYRRVNPEGAESQSGDRWNIDGKVTVLEDTVAGRAYSAAVNSEYVHTREVSQKITASTGGEIALTTTNHFFVALNGLFLWSDPDDASSESAFTVAPGVFWVPVNGTRIAFDYRFNNDVDGEDTFAVSVSQLLPGPGTTSTRLSFGVGKHGIVTLSAAFSVIPSSNSN